MSHFKSRINGQQNFGLQIDSIEAQIERDKFALIQASEDVNRLYGEFLRASNEEKAIHLRIANLERLLKTLKSDFKSL